jgi:hypothetical protein
MTQDINYPKPPEYYIAWSERSPLLISYGYVESNQCLSTGLDNIEVFQDEESFQARLLDFNIVFNQDL